MTSFRSRHHDEAVDVAIDSNCQHDCRDGPPYPVVLYIERYRNCLASRRFATMCLADDTKEICNVRTRCMRVTAVGSWVKRWRHWGGRRSTDLLCHFWRIWNLYIRCFEDFDYEWLVDDILSHFHKTAYLVWSRDPGEILSFPVFKIVSILYPTGFIRLSTWTSKSACTITLGASYQVGIMWSCLQCIHRPCANFT